MKRIIVVHDQRGEIHSYGVMQDPPVKSRIAAARFGLVPPSGYLVSEFELANTDFSDREIAGSLARGYRIKGHGKEARLVRKE
jgi:hypothetical protein